ncbi:MAG: hypothetical protein WBC19_10695 [Pyrinomonadaceae bacterium]
MRHCPKCNLPYDDTTDFCVEDGTPLGSFAADSPYSVGAPWDDRSSVGEIPTQYVSIPQPHSTPQTTSRNPNWSYVVIGVMAGVILMGGAYFLFMDPRGPDGERPRTENSAAAANSAANGVNGEINNLGANQSSVTANTLNAGVDESKLEATNNRAASGEPEMTANVDRVYRGHGGRLPLTLTLTRNGGSLSGAALTPGDRDDLEGTVSPDGTFRMRGFNLKENRVTGYWTGRVTNNSISGVWTATPSGKRVTFGGSR